MCGKVTGAFLDLHNDILPLNFGGLDKLPFGPLGLAQGVFKAAMAMVMIPVRNVVLCKEIQTSENASNPLRRHQCEKAGLIKLAVHRLDVAKTVSLKTIVRWGV